MDLNNAVETLRMTVFFPEGPSLWGFNFGFKQLFGQDTYTNTFNINWETSEINAKTDLMGLTFVLKYPTYQNAKCSFTTFVKVSHLSQLLTYIFFYLECQAC